MNTDFDLSSIDMTQTLPYNVNAMMNTGGIILASVFIVLCAIIFIRYKAKIAPLMLGLVAYVAFIFMGSNIVINLLPEFASTTNKASGIEVCMKALILTLFFTLARICVANIMKGRYDGPGDVMISGLSLGIGDGIVYGITTIMSLGVLATSISQVGLGEILLGHDLPADQALELYENSILPLINAPVITWALMGVSLCMDLVLNVGFMMLTCGAVNGKLTKDWHWLVAGMNFIILLPYTFNAIYYTSLSEVIISFGIKVVLFGAMVAIIYQVDKHQLGSMLKKDLRGYKYEKMPHFGNLKNR